MVCLDLVDTRDYPNGVHEREITVPPIHTLREYGFLPLSLTMVGFHDIRDIGSEILEKREARREQCCMSSSARKKLC